VCILGTSQATVHATGCLAAWGATRGLLIPNVTHNDHGGACARPHKAAVQGLQGSSSLALLGKHHQATALQSTYTQHVSAEATHLCKDFTATQASTVLTADSTKSCLAVTTMCT
jgi:hypothetical protein